LLSAMGLNSGPGAPSKDMFFANTGRINTSKDPQDSKGTATPSIAIGQRSDRGSETYVEIRGPSGLGQRSKTPYVNLLPKYKKRAEKAVKRDEIPKDQQKRVKDYFDSLESGK
jgi:hypothetical protein